MSKIIRINKKLYADAKKAADAEFRTIPKQIEYWANVGKHSLDNPGLPIDNIKKLFIDISD